MLGYFESSQLKQLQAGQTLIERSPWFYLGQSIRAVEERAVEDVLPNYGLVLPQKRFAHARVLLVGCEVDAVLQQVPVWPL